mmetsp:Transcript_19538/g.34306  ORF Transcript_19538/g.34306 Transcript_19538/m.34306 type:complete len:703 (+) Transcript_19538:81-2189(+)|eukprot:CAMPEP_0201868452 /NCGR_PEP_ID=MMETSP0902-20130614/2331_1 /ASSEMBLY_ACC=CAM_ASM_000551 /TAXON_ID=420261 /ORGANISM="Thalassiosira antarctica, Strain CCMP982" /LENGTH=702 /DNA_ID=CAMNT_0048393799 /DNA_START=73 /DNA_END=2181 /DNA_ORIENTATION=-
MSDINSGGFSFVTQTAAVATAASPSVYFGVPSPHSCSSNEIQESIKNSLAKRGGKYSEYSCKEVSWDDSSRSHSSAGGGLSCFGSNITDTYLSSKNGERLFTVRSDNWNEKLGIVSARDVAVVAGNTTNGIGGGSLAPATLEDVLTNMGSKYGGYTGMGSDSNLSDPNLDNKVSIRFQTVFIPVRGSTSSSSSERGTCEFATEAYNYSTHRDNDPRNLVLLCTTQGLAVQQDGRGKQRIFHHSLLPFSNKISRHWLEAEASSHDVGSAQDETAAEKADALARGKATAVVIGTRAIGTRFNVLMTIQVPLRQQHDQQRNHSSKPQLFGSPFGVFGGCAAPPPQLFGGFGSTYATPQSLFSAPAPPAHAFGSFGSTCATQQSPFGAQAPPAHAAAFGSAGPPPPYPTPSQQGKCSAARVSIGSKHDEWSGLVTKGRTLRRHSTERVTATIVIYNAVAGGVPSEDDAVAAIDDMERLYASCSGGSGNLAEAKFDEFKNGGTNSNKSPLFPLDASSKPPAVIGGSFFPESAHSQLGEPCMVPKIYCHGSAPAALKSVIDGFVYRSDVGVNDIFNTMGTPWLDAGVKGGKIDWAYHTFRVINDAHVTLHGCSYANALYNLACCVAVAARDDPTGVLVSGGMLGERPVASGATWAHYNELKNKGLEVSMAWLRQAKAAGYCDVQNIRTDPDLSELRVKFSIDVLCSLF